jgi:plasmid stabilization system protein ParE
MAFNVEISPRAFRDLDELATELKERSQNGAVARKWFLAVVGAIDSLAEMPERRPVVTEARDEIERVRLLLHGKRNRRYRIYYCVRKVGPSVERSAYSMCGIGHGKTSARMSYKNSWTNCRKSKETAENNEFSRMCVRAYPLVSELFAF